MPANDGLIILERGLTFNNIKVTEEETSADEQGAKFPAAIKKVIKEKDYLPAQVFNADESAVFWRRGVGAAQRDFIIGK